MLAAVGTNISFVDVSAVNNSAGNSGGFLNLNGDLNSIIFTVNSFLSSK